MNTMQAMKKVTGLCVWVCLLSPAMAFAADAPDVIIENLNTVAVILQVVSIVLGAALLCSGFMHLKRYGEMRTMMSAQMSMSGPLMKLVAAALLLTLPFFIEVGLQSMFGTTSVTAYDPAAGSLGMSGMKTAVVQFVRIVGVISFMRSVVMLARCGEHNGAPGNVAKAMIHMIGGVACINIVATLDILKSVLPI